MPVELHYLATILRILKSNNVAAPNAARSLGSLFCSQFCSSQSFCSFLSFCILYCNLKLPLFLLQVSQSLILTAALVAFVLSPAVLGPGFFALDLL